MAESESGSIISFGAVALLSVILYRMVSNTISSNDSGVGPSAPSGGGSPIVNIIEKQASSAGDVISEGAKYTGKEVAELVKSASSGKTNPFFYAGQNLGNDFVSWLKGELGYPKTSAPVTGESKTYGTGDTAYDEKVDSLTDAWVKEVQANKSSNVAQKGIDTLAAGYEAAKSGADSFTVGGKTYTKVVNDNKSSSGSSSGIKRQGGSGTGEDKVRIIRKS